MGNILAGTTCARIRADAATAALLAEVLTSSPVGEDSAVSICEDDGGRWRVDVYFGENTDEAALRALVAEVGGIDCARGLTVETLAAEDWVARSLEGLAPVEAGRFIVHGRHHRDRIPCHRLGLEIEAALAFGTGHHGTTRGCLLALDRLAKATRRIAARRPSRRQSILDVGTGTGVLAIAAAKLWHAAVLASDIDPASVRIARDNARRNGVASLVGTLRADGVSAGAIRSRAPYRLVMANILLAPLVRLSAPIAQLAAPGGAVILSGLLTSQAKAALAAYRSAGLVLEHRATHEGWVTLVMRRPHRKAGRPGR